MSRYLGSMLPLTWALQVLPDRAEPPPFDEANEIPSSFALQSELARSVSLAFGDAQFQTRQPILAPISLRCGFRFRLCGEGLSGDHQNKQTTRGLLMKRERERERETERQRDRDRDRQTDRDSSERDRDSSERDRERQRQRDTDTHKDAQ